MINLNRCRKAFDKTQHPLKIKDLIKVGIDGTCHKIIKDIYDKPTANIIFTGEKDKDVHSCHFYSSVLIARVTGIDKERKIKSIQTGKEEVNLSLSGGDMIGYIKNKLKIPPKSH